MESTSSLRSLTNNIRVDIFSEHSAVPVVSFGSAVTHQLFLLSRQYSESLSRWFRVGPAQKPALPVGVHLWDQDPKAWSHTGARELSYRVILQGDGDSGRFLEICWRPKGRIEHWRKKICLKREGGVFRAPIRVVGMVRVGKNHIAGVLQRLNCWTRTNISVPVWHYRE